METAHHFSSRLDCRNTADVPFANCPLRKTICLGTMRRPCTPFFLNRHPPSDCLFWLACPGNPDPSTCLLGQTLTSPQFGQCPQMMSAIILYMWRPTGRKTRVGTLTEDNCAFAVFFTLKDWQSCRFNHDSDACSCTPKK